ncbi:MAG: hypothetical protein JNJ47_02405 [Alphaproteobacteria bacterium]|nr:hypothetical protein [Alphaproteobacteria bacterium]
MTDFTAPRVIGEKEITSEKVCEIIEIGLALTGKSGITPEDEDAVREGADFGPGETFFELGNTFTDALGEDLDIVVFVFLEVKGFLGVFEKPFSSSADANNNVKDNGKTTAERRRERNNKVIQ